MGHDGGETMNSTHGTVAFVGLGHMGEPMAARLVAHGFPVLVHDLRSELVARFVGEHGAKACSTIDAAASRASFVITMLPDDATVRDVMLGHVVDALPHAGIAIDMGTSGPPATIAIATEFAKRGKAYVDAPVMGGVPFARDGTLEIMAGGDPEAVDRCRPIFDALGRRVWRCGASGSGHALKAIANFANAATFIALLEAMTIGRKFGLDASFMAEALQAMCAGRQHPLEKKIVPQVMTRRFATGMAIGLIAKDLGLAAQLADAVGARSSIVEETRALWQDAAERYGATRDQAEVVRLWEDQAGVELE
jgi:3-hydroxyisobutyrate dehydrogenase